MLHLIPKSEDDEGVKDNPFKGITEVPKWRRAIEIATQVVGFLTTVVGFLTGLVALGQSLWDILPL